MRHGKKFNHLGRKSAHRKAMLSNMSTSLLLHKRITTTLAKAKELRKHVEPLVTRAKEDTTHNRRVVFSYLQNKEAIKILFGEVAEKVGNRPGGYTRIIKTGYRVGDNAEMCIIELVDFNELMLKEAKPAKKATRRSRRGSSTSKSEDVNADATTSVDTEDKAAKEDSSKSEPKAKKAKQEQSEEPQAENSDKTEASAAEEAESVKADDSPKAEAADSPAQGEGDVNSDPKAEGDTPAKEDDGDQEKKPE